MGDRRLAMIEQAPMPPEELAQIVEMIGFAKARWKVAMSADVDRFRSLVHEWLGV
ncbi:MAG: hypothetical protein GY925_13755 [Actinomycetia bacterium]|nr:hypothetical protein [Actinomycetes bacterium]